MNLPDFSSTKRILVKRGSLVELADIGETNTGDEATLGAFVTWGLRTFPASKTALVIWDHGGATAGAAWDASHNGDPLSVLGMRRGLTSGLAGAGRDRLDLLGFDACLMGNLGVLYELRKLADVIVASEEVEPAHGWFYPPILTAMAGAPPTRELAKSVVAGFEAECREKKTIALCTLAAFDAGKLDAVVDSIDDLGLALHRVMVSTKDWTHIAHARDATEEYGASPGEPSPYGTIDAVDLADKALPLLADRTNHVKPAVDAATIAAVHGAARPDSHGLSLTFFRQGNDARREDAQLELAAHGRWASFLASYFAHQDGDTTPPGVSNPVAVATPGRGFRVQATVASVDDLDKVYGVVALPLPGGALSVVALPPLDADRASFTWDGTLPAISDGRNAVPATLFPEPQYADDDDRAVRVVSTRAKLLPDGDAARPVDVILYLSVSPDGTAAIHGVYKLAANGPANEVEFGEHDSPAPERHGARRQRRGVLGGPEGRGHPAARGALRVEALERRSGHVRGGLLRDGSLRQHQRGDDEGGATLVSRVRDSQPNHGPGTLASVPRRLRRRRRRGRSRGGLGRPPSALRAEPPPARLRRSVVRCTTQRRRSASLRRRLREAKAFARRARRGSLVAKQRGGAAGSPRERHLQRRRAKPDEGWRLVHRPATHVTPATAVH